MISVRSWDHGKAGAMRYAEINVFGIYISPFVPMMLAAWLITIGLRAIGDRMGLLVHVWHPALFVLCAYLVVLSIVVMVAAE